MASFESIVDRELIDGWRILDVGCGDGQTLKSIGVVERCSVVGVDLHHDSVMSALEAGYSNTVQEDVLDFMKSCKDSSYDSVVALDFIEHLEKESGLEILQNAKRIARYRVIVMTPTGFLFQPPDPDNLHQEHLSGWVPDELRTLGFQRIVGVRGWKPLRGYGGPKIRPRRVGYALLKMSEPFVQSQPERSFQFVAIWDRSEA